MKHIRGEVWPTDISLEKKVIRYRRMIDTLMGENAWADTVLKGGMIINVITREIYPGDLAIQDEFILMMGDCACVTGPKTKVIDVRGKYLSPGFIDAHMHFESSMLTATEFTRLSLAKGTTTVFADPHEIGNVVGLDGIKAMLDEAALLPNRVLLTIPALTPDVPGLETAGRDITSQEVKKIIQHPHVQGLGEMQGFSNVEPVYENTPGLLDDLLASVYYTKQLGKTVEGNAPALFGKNLAAHILICGNETSCHETTTKEECVEKLRNGVTVFIREGSTQRNMAECIRAVTEEGLDSRKLVLVTDDMVAEDLIRAGHMNDVIKRTINQGIDPVEAIQMATINPAYHFGLKDIGVLAPGKVADVCIINDLNKMDIDMVFVNGKQVAAGGELLIGLPYYHYPDSVKSSVHRERVELEELVLPSRNPQETVRVVRVIPDQNLTGCEEAVLNVEKGVVQPDIQMDILPLLSLERHGRTGKTGKCFVTGFGLKQGAIAQSIGHDTHNILATGATYEDIQVAVNHVIGMGGGIAISCRGHIIGDLPLPVAGLMTDTMNGLEVAEAIAKLTGIAAKDLSCAIHAPFMHLSFLSLVTSPAWKISDLGLVDVDRHRIIAPFV